MTTLANFIDSINVRFIRAAFRETKVPLFLNGTVEEHNVLIMVNSGNVFIGEKENKISERGFCFFPAGKPIYFKAGASDHKDLGAEGFTSDEHRNNYLRTVSAMEKRDSIQELFTVVGFDAMIYDVIPFFEVLDLQPFCLPPDEELGFLVKHISIENELEKIGKNKIIENYIEEIMIHTCRYMESQQEYKKNIDKLDFLLDRRLVDIVKYIRDNLNKDLSNKAIANVAFISEDYVGQFFKSLTGKNLQDYIENQRLEHALFLLRTQPDNIQEIAHRVGFKDPAYFSRRFKMKFGSNANAVRHIKNQMV